MKRGWARKLAPPVLIGVLLWLTVFPLLFRVELRGELWISVPAGASLMWTSADGAPPRGVYLPGAAPDGTGPRTLTLRERLPRRALREVALTWTPGPADDVVFRGGTIQRAWCGWVYSTVELPEARGDAAAPGRMVLARDIAPAAWVSVVGLAALVLAAGVAARLVRGLPRVLGWRYLPHAVVAGVVVGVGLFFCVRAACFMTSDGIDYADGAEWLASHASVERVVPYKAPGLTFVLALVMLVTPDYLEGFLWMQHAAGALCALLAWAMLRKIVATRWALLGALAVGVHPILVTYRCYMLRETLASVAVLGVAAAMVRLSRAPTARARWGWAAGLGAACAFGAYLRENLQLLLALVPIAMLVAMTGSWRTRAQAAATVLGVGVVLVLPWAVRNERRYDSLALVTPKLHLNRALSGWVNGVVDGNDTGTLDAERWRALEQARAAGKIGDYDYLNRILEAERERKVAASESAELSYQDIERVTRGSINAAVERRGPEFLRSSALSLVSQLGLWNPYRVEGASSNEWWSRPLRAQPFDFYTTVFFDIDASLASQRSPEDHERLRGLFTRVQRPIGPFWSTSWTLAFNDWFWAGQAIRPIVAVCFLAGIPMAWRRGERGLAGAGAVCLVCMVSAAWVVASATDRFGVPFLPVMLCLAACTMGWARFAAKDAGSGDAGAADAESRNA